ncbi:MAG: MmgE/PrpD family protein [Betaproteobacteria bacterium]|nr:MmgE/PrpD family protein [Betaproteobacteria bacterium]
MDDSGGRNASAATDRIQEALVDYCSRLRYEDVAGVTAHAAKVRVIDTLGALIGGFHGEACRIARNTAGRFPDPHGATIIGTRFKAPPEMAAFANATASRFVEGNDIYRWPHSTGGHPSDVIAPILSVAEYARASGREFVVAVVLAYEVYCRISDSMDAWGNGVEPANFACLGVASASARLLGLTPRQIAHAISIAAVSGNLLRQVRTGHLSVWKAVAAGEAGRAGVFAAMLAREGMEGPSQPFEGKHGWCHRVAGKPITLGSLGGGDVPFKVGVTLIKPRTACAATIGAILAAEKVAPALADVSKVSKVTVEVYKNAKVGMGTGEHHWNPDSRETADHSIPYVVAATLIDGTVTPRSFHEARRTDPRLRQLLSKIEVAANEEFTEAYERFPVEHHARVSVVMADGGRHVGEAGGSRGDLSEQKTDEQIAAKFRALSADVMEIGRANAALELLWALDQMENVAEVAPMLAFC